MDWRACRKNSFVKEIKRDQNLIDSLLKASANKFYAQGLLELNDETISSKITLVYDALRELLEALAISHGYKIYNHECYCYFLKDIMKKSALAVKFNYFRKVRNAINYYGEDISADDAKSLLDSMESFIEDVKNLLLGK